MNIYPKNKVPEHLQKYFEPSELGLEKTPEEYVKKITEIFGEVRRTLRDDGTLWIVIGDSYATNNYEGVLKYKDLVGIPWRVAFALQADGWYLRSEIIWEKPNSLPESVVDRPTNSHEHIFLLSKNQKYHYDADAIKEPLQSDPSSWGRHSNKDPGEQAPNCRPMFGVGRGGRDGTDWGDGKSRNKRSVWTVLTQSYGGEHFATYPRKLIVPCIKAGCPPGGVVLDPFLGSGTSAQVAQELGRQWYGIELNPDYEVLIKRRLKQGSLSLGGC